MLTRAIHRHSFKCEDLHSLSKVFEQNFWFFTWDLESGYHYVDIFSGHQNFLGFSWPFSGKVQGPSIWFEICLVLFYEVAKAFS